MEDNIRKIGEIRKQKRNLRLFPEKSGIQSLQIQWRRLISVQNVLKILIWCHIFAHIFIFLWIYYILTYIFMFLRIFSWTFYCTNTPCQRAACSLCKSFGLLHENLLMTFVRVTREIWWWWTTLGWNFTSQGHFCAKLANFLQ